MELFLKDWYAENVLVASSEVVMNSTKVLFAFSEVINLKNC